MNTLSRNAALGVAIAIVLSGCATGGSTPLPTSAVAPSVDPRNATPCLSYGLPAIQAQAAHLKFVRSAAEEYQLIRAEQPADRTLCTFQQVNGGVPVEHYEYRVHVGQSGDILLSSGRYSPIAATLPSQPKVSEISILEKAYTDAAAALAVEQPFLAPPHLLFRSLTTAQFQLTFELVASAPDKGAVRLIYNADNGQKLGQQRLASPK